MADGEKVGAKQKLYKLQKGEGGGSSEGGKQAKSGDELKPPETQKEKPNEEQQEVEKPQLKPTDKSGDKSSDKQQQSSGYGDRGADAPKPKDDKSHAGRKCPVMSPCFTLNCSDPLVVAASPEAAVQTDQFAADFRNFHFFGGIARYFIPSIQAVV